MLADILSFEKESQGTWSIFILECVFINALGIYFPFYLLQRYEYTLSPASKFYILPIHLWHKYLLLYTWWHKVWLTYYMPWFNIIDCLKMCCSSLKLYSQSIKIYYKYKFIFVSFLEMFRFRFKFRKYKNVSRHQSNLLPQYKIIIHKGNCFLFGLSWSINPTFLFRFHPIFIYHHSASVTKQGFLYSFSNHYFLFIFVAGHKGEYLLYTFEWGMQIIL